MSRPLQIIVALLCIVCVLALCIAPYADIPLTVLKALAVVIMLMFALVSAMLLLTGAFQLVLQPVTLRARRKSPMRSLFSPIDTNCVLQV